MMNWLMQPFALAAEGGTDTGVWIVLGVAAVLFVVTAIASRMRGGVEESPEDDEPATTVEQVESAPLPDGGVRAFGGPVGGAEDGALIAAITAAIMAARAEAGESGAFRVVFFKQSGRVGTRRRS